MVSNQPCAAREQRRQAISGGSLRWSRIHRHVRSRLASAMIAGDQIGSTCPCRAASTIGLIHVPRPKILASTTARSGRSWADREASGAFVATALPGHSPHVGQDRRRQLLFAEVELREDVVELALECSLPRDEWAFRQALG